MKIILASGSPRRKELLGHIFPEYEILPSDSEENATFQSPGQYVCELAKQKASDIAVKRLGISEASLQEAGADLIRPSYDFDTASLIVGADTIVYAADRVLGKPKDEEDAFRMLSFLSDRAHQVYTGICLLIAEKEDLFVCRSFYEVSNVYFDKLTESEIRAYIKSGEPLDKAGSYGIQGIFSKHIRRIDGDYFNVVGLPVNRLYHELSAIDKRFAL